MRLDARRPDLLAAIVKSGLCMGCGLCEGLFGPQAVRLELNRAHYFTPRELVPLSEEQRRLLARVCPGITLRHLGGSSGHHPIWGPCLELSICHAADPQTRHRGSSGGGVSAICVELLEAGLADYVVQIGASRANPLHNEVKVSRCRDEVLAQAGSRYSPSSPLVRIDQMLDQPGRFVFVGKPCDVAALRQLGREDRRVGEKVVAMLSFMCAGVPSLGGTYDLLGKMGAEPGLVRSLRYRGEGWPGLTKVVLEDGSEKQMSYEEAWGTILNRRLLLRCKICLDGTGEFADIVGADAWQGREDGYPDFAEHEGRSLVLVRTETGRRLLQHCLKQGALVRSQEIAPGDIAGMQPYQVHRRQGLWSRLWAMRLLGSPVPDYDPALLLRAAGQARLGLHLRSFLGMIRRELARKRHRPPGP